MILLFLCINLHPSDISFSRLEKFSMKGPVIIHFIPENSAISKNVIDIWDEFQSISRENESIYCLSINCRRFSYFCDSFFYPKNLSFISIYHKYYKTQDLTDVSIQGINNMIQNTFVNQSTFCQKFYLPKSQNIIYNYPTFFIKGNENLTCSEASKFKIVYPTFSFYIIPPDSNQIPIYTKIDLCYSPSHCIENSMLPSSMDFIKEYSLDHFGNWSLQEATRIRRRLALIIYDDSDSKSRPQRSTFEKFIKSFSKYFLFGSLPYAAIAASVEQMKKPDDCPFMILTNARKTRYMVVDYTRLKESQIDDKLNSARQGFLELSMDIFFDEKYSLRNGYNPKNVWNFALMAVCVIAVTALAICVKAAQCIRMYGVVNMKTYE